MSRYIDAEAYIEKYECCGYLDEISVEKFNKITPTADVVEVVRCKDCAYHYEPLDVCCGVPYVTTDNDFCSWGERREDEQIQGEV